MLKYHKLIVAGALFLSFHALGQEPGSVSAATIVDSDDQDLVLEEVVVTARKRMESLQESPVAISAFDESALREQGIATVRDLSSTVPGLSFTEQGSKATSIFIRGIGQRESNAVLDPSVGVYINGIFIARTDSQLLDAVDTQSIQVLRGPQGTLFGKNTTGGALLVTTNTPDPNNFSGSLSSRIGNFGRRDAKVTLNIPVLEDKLGVRGTLSSIKRDGYLDNTIDGKEYGDEDRLAASLRALWQVNDIFSVDAFAYLSKQNENGAGFGCLFSNPVSNISQLVYPQNGVLVNFEDVCRQSEALMDADKLAVNTTAFRMQSQIYGITLAWEFDDFELRSISAFGRQSDIVVEDDQDGTGISILQNGHLTRNHYFDLGGLSYDDEERDQFSQEFNLIGSLFDERLSYTLGLFFSHETMDNTPFTQAVGPDTMAMVGLLANVNTYISTHKLLATQSNLETDTAAAFAQGTYDINDYLQLTLGLRYTKEERKRELNVATIDWSALAATTGGTYLDAGAVEGIQYPSAGAMFAFADALAQGNAAIPLDPAASLTVAEDKSWSKLTPSITLSFNALEDLFNLSHLDSAMIYLTYSQGFKSGGFEPKGEEFVAFDPEEVSNIELGAKVDAFDHRLRINVAGYYMDYQDIQVRLAEKGQRISDLFLYLANAGEATIAGFEAEVSALLTQYLTLRASFNYTDAEYDVFDYVEPLTNVPLDRSDEPFGGTPEKSGSLSLVYERDLSDALVFRPTLSAYYSDELYIGLDYKSPDYDESYIDSYTLLSLRLSLLFNDNLEVTAFSDNLTDEDYYQGGFALADLLGAATVVKGPGRSYGLELYYRF